MISGFEAVVRESVLIIRIRRSRLLKDVFFQATADLVFSRIVSEHADVHASCFPPDVQSGVINSLLFS